MTRFSWLLSLGLLILMGCKADLSGLQALEVEELAALREAQAGVVLCDANNARTRSRYGVIPGAVLLSDYRDYDLAAELPADKGRKLVFYCHSERCGAAADAARKAVAGGYRDVGVLAVGITGWVEAGQAVDPAS
jgi:rhodanese-related sulfurtransferase